MSSNPNLATELIRLLNEFSLRFEENSTDFSTHEINDLVTDSEYYASEIEKLAIELKLKHIPIKVGENVDLKSNKEARYVEMWDPEIGKQQVILYLLLDNSTTTDFLQNLLTKARIKIKKTANRWIRFLKNDLATELPEADNAEAQSSAKTINPTLQIDDALQTITYKDNVIRFGGGQSWKIFELLYKANGDTVKEMTFKKETALNIKGAIAELRRFLRNKKAPEIATAIKNQTTVGYYLDIASL